MAAVEKDRVEKARTEKVRTEKDRVGKNEVGTIHGTAATAQARHVRVTPQKARRVVDLIRGRAAAEAVAMLQFAPQSASEPIRKVLQSAIANARVKADRASEAFDERALVVSSVFVDEGPTMKRFRPRAQGRAARINKRTSHITVVVSPREAKAGPPAKATAARTGGTR